MIQLMLLDCVTQDAWLQICLVSEKLGVPWNEFRIHVNRDNIVLDYINELDINVDVHISNYLNSQTTI